MSAKTPAPKPQTAPKATAAPIGLVVRCHRPQGLWRAGRYWPPEPTPVLPDELSPDQLAAVQAEPLLDVQAITE